MSDNIMIKCQIDTGSGKVSQSGYLLGVFQFAEPFNAVLAGTISGQISYPLAVVSHEDGTIHYYDPRSIKLETFDTREAVLERRQRHEPDQ